MNTNNLGIVIIIAFWFLIIGKIFQGNPVFFAEVFFCYPLDVFPVIDFMSRSVHPALARNRAECP